VAIPLQRGFDDLGSPLHDVTFCILDLETTGGSPATCEITEVGAVKYRAGELIGTFATLVNPGCEIPPTITVLTGITHAMVIDAPAIGEVLPSLLEFIGAAVIVGHNIRFDMSFLDAAAVRLGYGKLTNPTSDTLRLARRLVRAEVRRLDLGSLAAHLRSPVAPTHRALDDAHATAHVFWALLERAGTLGVTHLEDLMRLPTARGAPHYDKIGLTDQLPRRPGVYLFLDRDHTTIYVGKARNLRTRVRSYFYGDDRRSVTQMLRDLAEIDFRVCATDLQAEITELRLIHAGAPRYNRRSRPPRSTHWVKLTDERFPRLSIVRRPGGGDRLRLGPFRSRRAARLVVTALWDAVPIRRCTTAGGRRSVACDFAQLGVALCPCSGDVSDVEYGRVVDRLEQGIATDPAALLDTLADKVRAHARGAHFEAAADVRDRHHALSRALEDRRRWIAMQDAGLLWAEDAAGDSALIDHGRLAASWGAADAAPLLPAAATETAYATLPPDVARAEEARLVWRWLDRPGVHLIESSRPLTMPRRQVPTLRTLAD